MSLPATFATKVRPSDCHVWIGATNNKGYGVLTIDGRRHLAHRIAYEATYGPIPEGMVVDHVCRVRNCVRAEHLELVTSGENQRRGRRAGGLQPGDVCINGHQLAEGDIYVKPTGATECRHCRAASSHRPGRRRPTTQRRADRVRADLDLIASDGAA